MLQAFGSVGRLADRAGYASTTLDSDSGVKSARFGARNGLCAPGMRPHWRSCRGPLCGKQRPPRLRPSRGPRPQRVRDRYARVGSGVKVAAERTDIQAGMLTQPNLEEQNGIADTLQRPRLTMTAGERPAEALLSCGFAVAVVLMWRLAPPGGFALAPALVCLLVLVLAGRVRIDTPFGWTLPTQLAFVPLLFAMPAALVPLAVVAAMTIARLPDIVTGKMRLSRLVQAIPNAWFAVGPVAVFAIAGVSADKATPALLIAALAAQFIVDFTASGLRYAIGRGATLVELLSDSWVYVVDAALSGVALLAAEQIHRAPIAALAPLPLLGLGAMFARERRQRLESLIDLNTAYRRARDDAVEASNMKSAFLRNVSHEIRTPMNGVMGMNELLLGTELDSEQRAYAEQVEQSGEHMLAIINDILDISKIETGRLELDLVEFNLHEMRSEERRVGKECRSRWSPYH